MFLLRCDYRVNLILIPWFIIIGVPMRERDLITASINTKDSWVWWPSWMIQTGNCFWGYPQGCLSTDGSLIEWGFSVFLSWIYVQCFLLKNLLIFLINTFYIIICSQLPGALWDMRCWKVLFSRIYYSNVWSLNTRNYFGLYISDYST